MANFRTHIQFAAVGSGVLSALLLSGKVLSPAEAALCALAGALGGILPDIDSDNSHSLDILFAILSSVAAGLCLVLMLDKWPLYWVLGAALGVFILLQVPVRMLFAAFTVHRGVFHSLAACLLFTFLVAACSAYLGANAIFSWFLGAFTGLGFLLHLLLDEIYSVDFMNAKIKRSFGSALKLWHYGDAVASLLIICFAIIFYLLAPPAGEYLQLVTNKALIGRLIEGLTG